jgi:hypothetical protein
MASSPRPLSEVSNREGKQSKTQPELSKAKNPERHVIGMKRRRRRRPCGDRAVDEPLDVMRLIGWEVLRSVVPPMCQSGTGHHIYCFPAANHPTLTRCPHHDREQAAPLDVLPVDQTHCDECTRVDALRRWRELDVPCAIWRAARA